MEILQEKRSILSNSVGRVGLGVRSSLRGGVSCSVGGVEDLSGRHVCVLVKVGRETKSDTVVDR